MKTTTQLASLALLTALSCSVASAAAVTFDGAGLGGLQDYELAVNWDPEAVAGSDDDVTVTGRFNLTNAAADYTIKSLTVGAYSQVTFGSLTVTEDVTLNTSFLTHLGHFEWGGTATVGDGTGTDSLEVINGSDTDPSKVVGNNLTLNANGEIKLRWYNSVTVGYGVPNMDLSGALTFTSGANVKIDLETGLANTTIAGGAYFLVGSDNISGDLPTLELVDWTAEQATSYLSFVETGDNQGLYLNVIQPADLWVPSIFSSGMVLQSGQPVPVWGEGEPGETITVSFDGQVKDVVVGGDGRWSATLDALTVSMTGATLSVSASASLQTKTFTDVLVGEVWLLSGQSNMGVSLAGSDGGAEAAAAANYPWLRVFKQTSFAASEPARDVSGGEWVTCAPDNAGQISGVGFFFARALQASLPTNTPIALVNTQVGGTWIEQWVDIDTISAIPAAQPFIVSTNLPDPSLLYNGRVAPLQPFGIGGVIWYQGEGNTMATLDSAGYVDELKGLVTSWRQQWQQPDLPFLVVQLPRYHAEDWSQWPEVRNAQAQAAHDMDGVEVAVTIDLGEELDIHPTNKEPVGERLALLARAKVYGEAIDCYGPFFQSSEIDGGDVLVEWANADGLFFTNGVAQGFEICGTDGVFVSAQAEILPDNRVRVYSPTVPEPACVRYGWFNWGEVSLFNGLDLPAAPFSWHSGLKPEYEALVTTTTYTGSGALIDVDYSSTAGSVGQITATDSDSWDNGLASYLNPGLYDGTVGGGTAALTGSGDYWYGVAVRQTGGALSAVNFGLRGGVETNDDAVGFSILEIDDASNTGFGTKNLYISGTLTMWNQNVAAGATGNTLSVLNGWADVGALNATSSADEFINILNGKLDVGSFGNAKVTVNMLATGTGQFNLDEVDMSGAGNAYLGNMVLNFETCSEASFTIVSGLLGADAGEYWATHFAVGDVQIDGVTVTDLSLFTIEDVGATGTKISLTTPTGTWRWNYFGDSSNSGDGADTANPDTDSLVNLLEFAFGTNPNLSDASALTVDGGGSFTPGTPIVDVAFTPLSVKACFIRLVDHTNSGITYTAQFSHDLSTWDDLAGSTAVRIPGTSPSGGYEAVELSYPTFLSNGRKARFYRVQINETASGETQP